MEIRKLFADEDAVSPVIGVILMVAITVILAAVIGTFVLGLGDQVQSTSPQASINFDFSGSTGATAIHDGGDTLDPAQISLTTSGSGTTEKNTSPTEFAAGSEIGYFGSDASGTPTDLASGDDIRVVWTSSSGDNSATLGKTTAP